MKTSLLISCLNHYEDFSVGKLSLFGEDISGLTIYWGWMMRPEMYRNLYLRLEEQRIILINTPEEYEKYHMLPEAPHDEFDSESKRVERQLRYDSSVEKIAEAVSKVFSCAFEPQDFTIDACMDVAIKMKEKLDEKQRK